jgi:hypothetical protein
MSEQQSGGSVDRDDEDQRETPPAEQVLTTENGVDEAAEKARETEDPEAD